MENEMMDKIFWGNSFQSYMWCAGILVIGILFRHLFSKGLSWLAYRFLKNYSKGDIGFAKFSELLKKPFGFFITVITIYFAFSRLNFPIHWEIGPIHEWGLRMFLLRIFQSTIVIAFTWIVLRLTDFFGLILMHKASLTESKTDDQLVPFIKESIKIIILIISLFTILGAVFNMNITSLIAGLGIGGLAIALAAKESLENLLGSFTIFLDKPFVIGDLIKIGSLEGNVEQIGFRSTRIRTLEKTFVTVPNKKIVDSELDNLTQREIRRIKIDIGLRYDTPLNVMEACIAEIKAMIEKHPNRTEDVSVFFFEFANFSLNIRIIYFLTPPTWSECMIAREQINFEIMKIVAKNGAGFAFPTSTIIMEKEADELN